MPLFFLPTSGQDHTGWSAAGAGDVNCDGYQDLVVGEPGASQNLGRIRVISGGPVGGGVLGSTIYTQYGTGTGSDWHLGMNVGSVGDIDGDGTADFSAIGCAGFATEPFPWDHGRSGISLRITRGSRIGAFATLISYSDTTGSLWKAPAAYVTPPTSYTAKAFASRVAIQSDGDYDRDGASHMALSGLYMAGGTFGASFWGLFVSGGQPWCVPTMPPIGITVAHSCGGVDISWVPLRNARGYAIYRNGSLIAGGSDPAGLLHDAVTHRDTPPPGSHTYEVAAYRNCAGVGPRSQGHVVVFSGYAPQVTVQPSSLSVAEGSPATLTATVSNALSAALQWRRNGNIMPGANGATLTIPVVSRSHGGLYDCVATNACGAGTSQASQVTVGFVRTEHTGCGSLTMNVVGSPVLGGSLAWLMGGFQGVPVMRAGFSQVNQALCPPIGCRLGPDFLVASCGHIFSVAVPVNSAFIGLDIGVQGVDLGPAGSCQVLQLSLTDTEIARIG